MSSSKPVEMSNLSPKGFGPKPPVKRTIIRRKKRAVSFERRFLSARGSGNCSLEIAVIWRDNVMSVKQFRADNQARVTIGPDSGCDYVVDTGAAGKITIAHCINNQWQILFNNAYDGFVLRGDEKVEFKSASNHEFKVPAINEQLQPGSLACDVTGDVRAKYTFGEVSVLVRYISAVPFAAPLLSRFKAASYGPLAASLAIHFALFSVILFATSRVDALMVDRILNTSRFVTEIEQPVEDPIVDDTIDEVPVDDEVVQEVVKDTTVAAPSKEVGNGGSGKVMTKAAAQKMAQGTGLLTEATRMNSLLGAGPTAEDLNALDFYHFDPTVAAQNQGYDLKQTGPSGLPGVSSISGDPTGFTGNKGGNLVKTGHDTPILTIPKKDEAVVKPGGKIDVSGTLDRITVQKVVRQHFGELRACYEREAIKIKGLAGRIVVVWIIAANGSVTKALVKESTMNNKTVENCVINSVNHWRFPALKNGGMSQIEYPFDFILSK